MLKLARWSDTVCDSCRNDNRSFMLYEVIIVKIIISLVASQALDRSLCGKNLKAALTAVRLLAQHTNCTLKSQKSARACPRMINTLATCHEACVRNTNANVACLKTGFRNHTSVVQRVLRATVLIGRCCVNNAERSARRGSINILHASVFTVGRLKYRAANLTSGTEY